MNGQIHIFVNKTENGEIQPQDGNQIALEDKDVETVLSLLSEIGEEAYVIGKVTDSGEVDLVW